MGSKIKIMFVNGRVVLVVDGSMVLDPITVSFNHLSLGDNDGIVVYMNGNKSMCLSTLSTQDNELLNNILNTHRMLQKFNVHRFPTVNLSAPIEDTGLTFGDIVTYEEVPADADDCAYYRIINKGLANETILPNDVKCITESMCEYISAVHLVTDLGFNTDWITKEWTN